LAGLFYLVATPIGNLEDITIRALRVLRDEVTAIACEDTRQTQKLLEHFEIRKPLISYHEHNETSRAAEIVERLANGESIALVSDAGTPLISDPGFRAVAAAIRAGITVVPLPGASALLTALAASGLPVDQFRFIGFLPPRTHARKEVFEELKAEQATVIAYESPHRILESLADLAEVLETRPLALGRELTKLHEEFLRGTASEIHAILASRHSVKGEITLVIGRAAQQFATVDPKEAVLSLELQGIPRMEAIKAVAKQLGLPKRAVYRLLAEGLSDAVEPGSNRAGKRRD
jgi:16S rRNA (cytidine1402-2'-O)-methyltransferase